jgi:hypothetical protein
MRGPTRAQRFGAAAVTWMALIALVSAQPQQRLRFMQHIYAAPHRVFAQYAPAVRAHGLVGWLDQQNYACILDSMKGSNCSRPAAKCAPAICWRMRRACWRLRPGCAAGAGYPRRRAHGKIVAGF